MLAISATSSPCFGMISNASGSGFPGNCLVSSGLFFCMIFSAFAFETNFTDLISGIRAGVSRFAILFSCARVASLPHESCVHM